MRFSAFRSKFQAAPLILGKDIPLAGEESQAFRNQLTRWQKRGLILRLKRGVYILSPAYSAVYSNPLYIANQLYFPSYVSLEFALSFYGLIPEKVYDVTSVTTKKTAHFRNKLGTFTYRHILPKAFRGFKAATDSSGINYFIAEPEKAMVDLLYLNIKPGKVNWEGVFSEHYRFQNLEGVSQKKIFEFAKFFESRRLDDAAKKFCEFKENEG